MISSMNCKTLVKELMQSIADLEQFEAYFLAFKEKYKFRCLEYLQPAKIYQDIERFIMESPSDSAKSQQSDKWVFRHNELKYFCWILVAFCYNQKTDLEKLIENKLHLSVLNEYFPLMSLTYLKYRIMDIQPAIGVRKKRWSQEESSLLTQIMKDFLSSDQSDEKMRRISYQLFKKSQEKFYRTPVQCQQRWRNHENKEYKKKQGWTLEDDYTLFQYVEQFNFQWKEMANDLFEKSRTSHTIKNRYNTIMKNKRKKNLKNDKTGQQVLINRIRNELKKTISKKRKDQKDHQSIPNQTKEEQKKEEDCCDHQQNVMKNEGIVKMSQQQEEKPYSQEKNQENDLGCSTQHQFLIKPLYNYGYEQDRPKECQIRLADLIRTSDTENNWIQNQDQNLEFENKIYENGYYFDKKDDLDLLWNLNQESNINFLDQSK